MGRASPAVVSGPLAAYAEGFHAALVGQGYTLNSAGFQLWLMAHLSRWLTSQGLGPSELSTATLERFLEARRDAGYTQWLSMRAMAPLLGYLRQSASWQHPSLPLRQHPSIVCWSATGTTWPPSGASRRARSAATSTSPASSLPDASRAASWTSRT